MICHKFSQTATILYIIWLFLVFKSHVNTIRQHIQIHFVWLYGLLQAVLQAGTSYCEHETIFVKGHLVNMIITQPFINGRNLDKCGWLLIFGIKICCLNNQLQDCKLTKATEYPFSVSAVLKQPIQCNKAARRKTKVCAGWNWK